VQSRARSHKVAARVRGYITVVRIDEAPMAVTEARGVRQGISLLISTIWLTNIVVSGAAIHTIRLRIVIHGAVELDIKHSTFLAEKV
jgi:hypothetical protein